MARITQAMEDEIRDDAFANGLVVGGLAMLLAVAVIFSLVKWNDHRDQENYDFRAMCFYKHGQVSRDGEVCKSREDGRVLFIKSIEGTWR